MSETSQTEETKCVAVKLPASLIHCVDVYRDKADMSKNAALVELIEKGLRAG